VIGLLARATFAALVAAGSAQAGSPGTLQLRGVFHVKWDVVECPAGTSSSTSCFVNVGRGSVRGLGPATERYTLRLVNGDSSCAGWRYTATLTLAGRDTLSVSARNRGCFSAMQTDGTVVFRVAGGSGRFARARGSGTIASKNLTEPTPGHGTALDIWTGSLSLSD
jgi:hypothetical protein